MPVFGLGRRGNVGGPIGYRLMTLSPVTQILQHRFASWSQMVLQIVCLAFGSAKNRLTRSFRALSKLASWSLSFDIFFSFGLVPYSQSDMFAVAEKMPRKVEATSPDSMASQLGSGLK